MMRRFLFVFYCITLTVAANTSLAQDDSSVIPPSVRPDTTEQIKDQLIDTFILNHVPLSTAELNILSTTSAFSVYGNLIDGVIKKGGWYNIGGQPELEISIPRARQHNEWLFYTFISLFLFIGLIHTLYSTYFTKLFRGYFNQGFIFFQAKEQLSQYPMASLLMNVFFFFTSSFFIYLELIHRGVQIDLAPWELVMLIALFLLSVYVFKIIILTSLGWLFNQMDLFKSYIFIVFLNNKVAGVILFLSTFMISFATDSSAITISNVTISLLVIALMFRFIKGFTIFARQAKMSIFSYVLAVLSLEVLPSAVLVKFILEDMTPVVALLRP